MFQVELRYTKNNALAAKNLKAGKQGFFSISDILGVFDEQEDAETLLSKYGQIQEKEQQIKLLNKPKIDKLNVKIERLEAKKYKYEEQTERLEERIQKKDAALERLYESESSNFARVKKLEKESEELTDKANALDEKCDELTNEINKLEGQVADFQELENRATLDFLDQYKATAEVSIKTFELEDKTPVAENNPFNGSEGTGNKTTSRIKPGPKNNSLFSRLFSTPRKRLEKRLGRRGKFAMDEVLEWCFQYGIHPDELEINFEEYNGRLKVDWHGYNDNALYSGGNIEPRQEQLI